MDTEAFKVTEVGGLRLIMPHHSTAGSNDAWERDNLWLRSRVECMKNKDTISQGFGKFFNLGQGPDGLRIEPAHILDAIHNNRRVVATLKYDGSCLIRSVYKGEVFFRTRGSLKYEYHDNAQAEMEQFLAKYPKLADPTWEAGRSLLFEWVTPSFQIVIPYEEADLFLLGAVDHGHRHYSHLRYSTMEELEPISAESGVKLIEYHVIDSVKKWHEFYHETLNHREIEGYVLRMDDEQNLVKVKSTPYVTKHGIKSNLSFKSMVEFWLQHGQESVYQAILGQIEKLYDEEVVMWALPFIDNLFIAVDAWTKTYEELTKVAMASQHWARKDFAVEMQKRYTGEDRIKFSMLMQLWQGKPVEERMIREFMMRFDEGVKGQFSNG